MQAVRGPWLGILCLGSVLVACGDPLPDDLNNYATRCVVMNKQPILPYEGDPHKGFKNVYACNVPLEFLQARTRPFPDGTVIVKESRREGESFTWLVATARKQQGRWRWDEYTRNFDNEDHRRLALPQSKCTDCHAAAADYIFTRFEL